MFIKYEAEVSSRVGGGERGVVDSGKLFTETNEQKTSFTATSLSLLQQLCKVHNEMFYMADVNVFLLLN